MSIPVRPVDRSSALPLALLLSVVLLAWTSPARGDVGYAMRGDARPFHHWDSLFNNTPAADGAPGLVWHAGDVTLRPTLGAWAVHDDNLFLANEDPESDTSFTVTPGLLLLYGQADRNYVTANYEFENTDYADFPEEDYESHLFSIGLQLVGRGYTTRLSEQYGRTTDSDPESVQRVTRTDHAASAGVERNISRRTGADVHGRYESVAYDGTGFIDYDEWSGGLELRHHTWPKTHLAAGADYGQVDAEATDDRGDAEFVQGAVGLRGEPALRTTVEARVGYEQRDFDNGDDGIDTWIASAGAARTFWRESVAGINVSRRLLPSSQREGLTRVPLTISPYVQHEILRDRLALGLSGAYEEADYYDAGGKTDRSDTRWHATALLDWRVLDGLTAGVGVTREEQDSDVAANDYTRKLTFLRVLGNY